MSEKHSNPSESEAEANQPSKTETGADVPATSTAKKRIPKRFFFFASCIVIAIVVFCCANADSIAAVFSNLMSVLSPLIIGGVIAYLCNPIMRFFEYFVFGKMKKGGLHHALSLLCTVIVFFGIIVGIIALIVPELVNSLTKLVDEFDFYLDSVLTMVQGIIDKFPQLDIDVSDKAALISFIEDTFGSMEEFISNLLTTLQKYVFKEGSLDTIMTILSGVISTFTNILLGFFIAFYILASKEKRSAQIRKFRAACLTEKQNKKFKSLVRLVNQTFGGYVKGLILDSIAIGIVMFIILSVFRISEYNLLIATICAITNIIPVFGPFIGAIPSGLLVLITNPSKFIPFLIIVLVVQQIEGNIIMPRIQGNSTNISSLSVLIAITVMGNLFGVVGMIVGVPIFAVIIELFKRWIEGRLEKRGLPTDTVYYYPDDAVGNAEEEVHYEHSHLRYKYEHSKLKARIDRIRASRTAKKAERIKKKEIMRSNASGQNQKTDKKK